MTLTIMVSYDGTAVGVVTVNPTSWHFFVFTLEICCDFVTVALLIIQKFKFSRNELYRFETNNMLKLIYHKALEKITKINYFHRNSRKTVIPSRRLLLRENSPLLVQPFSPGRMFSCREVCVQISTIPSPNIVHLVRNLVPGLVSLNVFRTTMRDL